MIKIEFAATSPSVERDSSMKLGWKLEHSSIKTGPDIIGKKDIKTRIKKNEISNHRFWTVISSHLKTNKPTTFSTSASPVGCVSGYLKNV